MSFRRVRPLALVPFAALAAPAVAFAQAQATVKPDGNFRSALTAAGSYASGNTDASSASLDGQAVRATAIGKLLISTKGVWSRNTGVVTANNLALDSEYDRDLTPTWFTLGKADYLRDAPAKVAMTPLLSLTLGFNYRYNSEPGQGQKPSDTLVVTGITVRVD